MDADKFSSLEELLHSHTLCPSLLADNSPAMRSLLSAVLLADVVVFTHPFGAAGEPAHTAHCAQLQAPAQLCQQQHPGPPRKAELSLAGTATPSSTPGHWDCFSICSL